MIFFPPVFGRFINPDTSEVFLSRTLANICLLKFMGGLIRPADNDNDEPLLRA